MMFRRLYWVTEEINANGGSGVSGVYTSIPDLVKNGIETRNGKASRLRLSLVKLDGADGPLGVWEAPNFSGIEESLQEYVRTDEISADQCQSLFNQLKKIGSAKA
jgi:hypothetical protein